MFRCVLVTMCLGVTTAAFAQQRSIEAEPNTAPTPQFPVEAPSTVDSGVGRTAVTGSGRIGQRQTREEAAPNMEPLSRIQNRIANRVQSRIRNRIDPYYDPQANTTSPFEVAGDQSRINTHGRR